MKSNGSVYVAAVIAALAAYFTYQWWFNPARAIKQRLGQVAAALSVPAPDSDIARLERLAALRRDRRRGARLRPAGPQPAAPREAVLAVGPRLRPPGRALCVHVRA